MKIGFSLFWSTLLHQPHPNHPANWERAFPDMDQSLDRLKEFGLTSIELKLTERVDISALFRAIEKVLKRDFHVTIHAAGRIRFPADVPWQIQNISDISRQLHEKFFITPLWVIHPLYGIEIPRNEVFDQTLDYLKTLTAHLADDAVTLALEILRNRPDNEKIHVGDSYHEILDLLTGLDSRKWGICWDFGHAFSMYERNLQSKFPPQEFLDRVVHCHVHDSKDQITHLPLGQGHLPIQQNIHLLMARGYDGIFNLEIEPHKVRDPENFMNYLNSSISLLKKIFDRAGETVQPASPSNHR
ncbi:MAG: sugar phosphate isomerase/epimerase family protein [Candidatus Zhuqueibacterota bacterium]